MIPFLDLRAQFSSIGEELVKEVTAVLSSTQYVLGPSVESFEKRFADYCGVDHCVGVSSGTSALHMALLAHGVGPGDEVITVAQTFIATVAAIDYCGAEPVLIDVDSNRQTMCPERLHSAITSRTKAIVPVHLYGQPADMDPISQIAKEHGIPVVADAAQSHGAIYKGRPIAALSDSAAFSFYPGKNLGACGEAGAVVTNNEDIAKRVRMLRDWGQQEKNVHELVGFNNRMDAVQAAVLNVKLNYLDAWNQARRSRAMLYLKTFDNFELPCGLQLPSIFDDSESAWHLFVVRVDQRDAIRVRLERAGVQTGVHYPVSIHLTPAFRQLGISAGSLPCSERNAERVLSLPLYPELRDSDVERVVEQVLRAIRNS